MATPGPLSYSSVRTYLECPLRWKFLYIERRPETPRGYFSFGRTVHLALETLLRPLVVPEARTTESGARQRTLADWGTAETTGGQLMARERFLELYESVWIPDGYTSGEEESRYRALGRELLGAFYDRIARAPPRPVAIEAHLEATWDGIPIHGYIDRLDRGRAGGLEVVDYKTSRELSGEDARTSDQLAIYQVLVEHNYPLPVERLTLVHLRSGKPYTSAPRDREALGELFDRVGQVSDGIRAEAYEPTPGRQCRSCEFRSMCPEFREVPATDQARLAELVDRFAGLRERETELSRDLARTAEELHREAERLAVHRVAGGRTVAVRRREERWRFPPEMLSPLLAAHGLADRLAEVDERSVRRLLRDPALPPELRRKIAETARREVRWYWSLDGDASR